MKDSSAFESWFERSHPGLHSGLRVEYRQAVRGAERRQAVRGAERPIPPPSGSGPSVVAGWPPWRVRKARTDTIPEQKEGS